MMGWRWFSLLPLCGLLGCGHSSLTERVVMGNILEAHLGEVAVFEEGTRTPDYEEIAFLRTRIVDSDEAFVLSQLRNEAAMLGANAVVHVTVGRFTNVVVASGVAAHVR